MEITTNDIINYLKAAKVNYIIVQPSGEALKFNDGNPVVYGGEEDYAIHKQEGDRVITEFDYIMKETGVLE